MVIETISNTRNITREQSCDSTQPETVAGWYISYSQNPAKIVLNNIRSSFDETDIEELLDGMELTKQAVFEKFYGASERKA